MNVTRTSVWIGQLFDRVDILPDPELDSYGWGAWGLDVEGQPFTLLSSRGPVAINPTDHVSALFVSDPWVENEKLIVGVELKLAKHDDACNGDIYLDITTICAHPDAVMRRIAEVAALLELKGLPSNDVRCLTVSVPDV